MALPSNETVSNGSLNCDHDVGNSFKVTLLYALLKTDTTSHAFLAGGVGAAVLIVGTLTTKLAVTLAEPKLPDAA